MEDSKEYITRQTSAVLCFSINKNGKNLTSVSC